MSLAEKLLQLRKKEGFSQEEAAEKLQVTRQTISKWETGQSVPELKKAKQISELYNVSYEFLMSDYQENVDITDMDALSDSIDWTKAWAKKYPVLGNYQKLEGLSKYHQQMKNIYQQFKKEYNLSDVDTALILKDIFYHTYLEEKKK